MSSPGCSHQICTTEQDSGVTAGKVSRFDNIGYGISDLVRFTAIWSNLSDLEIRMTTEYDLR